MVAMTDTRRDVSIIGQATSSRSVPDSELLCGDVRWVVRDDAIVYT